jgi:hypothetical protein
VYYFTAPAKRLEIPVRNVTITLDEKTASWLRRHAAERGVSVSRFVGEVLREHMQDAREYDAAMHRFLAQAPFAFELADGRPPSRDELHDRAGLR